jgi:hypothetical protein
MQNYQLTALIFLVVYYVFIIGLSLYRRMVKSEVDYFLANRTWMECLLCHGRTNDLFGYCFSISC